MKDMQTINHDSDVWKILGIGVTREDGRTMMHLASTTRFFQQKNGAYPIQICDWIDTDEGAQP